MKHKNQHWLRNPLIKVAQIHLLLVLAYTAQIIIYDASKLITPDVVLTRWYAIGALAVVATVIWYIARSRVNQTFYYKALAWGIIAADLLFAAFNVYTQRGMASRAVILFIIPIAVSAILMSRIALFATAILAVIAYTTASVAYFVNYFNEGYKVELYGEILFYSSVLLITAALLWPLVKLKRS